MFNKNILISTVVVFITMMVFGFLVFGIALNDFYQANIGDVVIRKEGEELMEWLAIAQLIMAYAVVWIWSHDAKNEGIMEGIRFGFFIGLFLGGTEMIFYAFVPMAQMVMIVNFVADIIMMMVTGAVLSMVWGMLTKPND